MTVIGILLIIIAIVLLVARLVIPAEKESVRYQNTDSTAPGYTNNPRMVGEIYQDGVEIPLFLKKLLKPIVFYSILGVGVLLTLITSVFFYNPPGTLVAVQYLWGGDKMISSQGLKANWLGRTLPFHYEIAFQDTMNEVKSADQIYYRTAKMWEFNDAIKARISTSIVIGVQHENEEQFLDMADRNRTEEKLVYARIIAIYDQAVKNTCKLFSAQDYIAGAASDFDRAFHDQFENGMYLLEEYYTEDDDKPEIIGDSAVVRTVIKRQKENSKTKKYRPIKDKTGNYLRDNTNSLSQYGLRVIQASVSSIDWEAAFDERLDLQKDQVAKTQLEKQEAIKEFYRAQKEVATGEANKAKSRASLEQAQLSQTIEAETQAKVASFKELEESNLLAASRKSSQRKKIDVDADAYVNRQLVAVGLTPMEKAEWAYKTEVDRAKALAGPQGVTFPTTYISGSGGNGKGNDDMLTLFMLNLMNKK